MLSASFAVAAFVGCAVADHKPANNTYTGVVVSTVDGKLTMIGKNKKEHTHTVAKDATITCNGKDCKLEDLKKDQTVTVTFRKQGDDYVVTKIEAKSAEDKEEKIDK